jgi:hypothetical protein
MRVDGPLNLARSTLLRSLPYGLCARTIDVTDCPNLFAFPGHLACEELLLDRTNVAGLPFNLSVSRLIRARDCRQLHFVPPITVERLDLAGCVSLEQLSDGLTCHELILRGCVRLTKLPAMAALHVRHLDLSDCSSLAELPEAFGQLESLNLNGCSRIAALPDGLRIRSWIDVAGTSLRSLPWSLRSTSIRWRGTTVSDRIAFGDRDDFSIDEILGEPNLTYRSVLIERVGMEWLVDHAGATTFDCDRDRGGERRLLQICFDAGEDIVCVVVRCPSTGSRYVLRVPPYMRSCAQAVAWTAGFTDPDSYRPEIET